MIVHPTETDVFAIPWWSYPLIGWTALTLFIMVFNHLSHTQR